MELLPVSWVTSHGLFSFSFSSSKPSVEVQNTLAKTLCNTPDILDLPSSQNQKSSTPNLMGWREESGQGMAIGVLCRPTSQVQTSWCQDRCNTNQRMARRCLCRVVSCPFFSCLLSFVCVIVCFCCFCCVGVYSFVSRCCARRQVTVQTRYRVQRGQLNRRFRLQARHLLFHGWNSQTKRRRMLRWPTLRQFPTWFSLSTPATWSANTFGGLQSSHDSVGFLNLAQGSSCHMFTCSRVRMLQGGCLHRGICADARGHNQWVVARIASFG